MRRLVPPVVAAVAVVAGTLTGACWRQPPCRCPRPQTMAPGRYRVAEAAPDRLAGATVDVTREELRLTYAVDGAPREIVLRVTERWPEP